MTLLQKIAVKVNFVFGDGVRVYQYTYTNEKVRVFHKLCGFIREMYSVYGEFQKRAVQCVWRISKERCMGNFIQSRN